MEPGSGIFIIIIIIMQPTTPAVQVINPPPLNVSIKLWDTYMLVSY